MHVDEIQDLLLNSQRELEAVQSKQALKDTKTPFQAIKEKIRMARKPRMRSVVKLLCDRCDKVIMEEEDGYIVHGNIYVASSKDLGGLVGNNFPEEGDIEDVQKTVLCVQCMLTALNLNPQEESSGYKARLRPEAQYRSDAYGNLLDGEPDAMTDIAF